VQTICNQTPLPLVFSSLINLISIYVYCVINVAKWSIHKILNIYSRLSILSIRNFDFFCFCFYLPSSSSFVRSFVRFFLLIGRKWNNKNKKMSKNFNSLFFIFELKCSNNLFILSASYKIILTNTHITILIEYRYTYWLLFSSLSSSPSSSSMFAI
jgi:hypothetical protein